MVFHSSQLQKQKTTLFGQDNPLSNCLVCLELEVEEVMFLKGIEGSRTISASSSSSCNNQAHDDEITRSDQILVGQSSARRNFR